MTRPAFAFIAGAIFVLNPFIGPALSQFVETKLIPEDLTGGDRFGYSISMSNRFALVSSPRDDDMGNSSGSAYVLRRDDSTWSIEEKLLASDGSFEDYFGISVCIDNETAVVGAWRDDPLGNNSGSSYVFERDSGWTESAKLVPSDGAPLDNFGIAVSVSGAYIVVGASNDDENGPGSGSAYFYSRNDSGWLEMQKVIPHDGSAGEQFGASVSIDGEYAVIGAWGDNDNGGFSGSVYVFHRTDSGWIETTKLLASDGTALDMFGASVSLSGEHCLIGARGEDDRGPSSGAAYIFKREEANWTESAKLRPEELWPKAEFGFSVALEDSLAVVGAWHNRESNWHQGSAFVYALSETEWQERARLVASDGGEGDFFGFSVANSGDFAIAGTQEWTDQGDETGSIYIYGGIKAAHAPESPVLLFPTNRALTHSDTVTFTWNSSRGIDRYWFELSPNPDFAPSLIDSSVTDTAHVSVIGGSGTYWWRVRAHNEAGWGPFGEEWGFTIVVTAVGEGDEFPTSSALHQNFPNPFNPSTIIQYQLDEQSYVKLGLYNLVGELVLTLVDEMRDAGNHEVIFDAGEIPSGVYFYRLRARHTDGVRGGEFVATRKLALIK